MGSGKAVSLSGSRRDPAGWQGWRWLAMISPVFLLTVKHWTNLVVMLLFLGAMHYLRRPAPDMPALSPGDRRWQWAMAVCLAAPFFAVLIGQSIRQEWFAPNLDAPLRLLLCVPIFLAVSRGWLNPPAQASIFEVWLSYSFPLCLIGTLLVPWSWTEAWGAHRMTTYFVDPLSLSSLTLALALMSLIALPPQGLAQRWLAWLCGGLGVWSGVLLSLGSGSRTGWLGLPFCLGLWIHYLLIPRQGQRVAGLALVLALLAFALIPLLAPALVEKIELGWNELRAYRWQAMNPDSSIGLRISTYRMGIEYFLQRPWAGWGEHGWRTAADTSAFQVFASDFSIYVQTMSGFHNEILTSSVRSGVWGLLSAAGFFAGPAAFGMRVLRRNPGERERLVVVGLLVFIVHLFIVSLGTEVNHLVFLASFNGLTLAVAMGWLFSTRREPGARFRTDPGTR